MEKIKLHIGCGTLYKENWINIDNNSDNNIEQLDIIEAFQEVEVKKKLK